MEKMITGACLDINIQFLQISLKNLHSTASSVLHRVKPSMLPDDLQYHYPERRDERKSSHLS